MGYTNEKCPIAFIYAKTVPTLINGKKKYENMNTSTRKLYHEGCICLLWMTNSVLMLIADDVADGFVVSVSPITRFPGVPLRVAPYHKLYYSNAILLIFLQLGKCTAQNTYYFMQYNVFIA